MYLLKARSHMLLHGGRHYWPVFSGPLAVTRAGNSSLLPFSSWRIQTLGLRSFAGDSRVSGRFRDYYTNRQHIMWQSNKALQTCLPVPQGPSDDPCSNKQFAHRISFLLWILRRDIFLRIIWSNKITFYESLTFENTSSALSCSFCW